VEGLSAIGCTPRNIISNHALGRHSLPCLPTPAAAVLCTPLAACGTAGGCCNQGLPCMCACCLQYEMMEAVKKGEVRKVQACLAAGVSANCKDFEVGAPSRPIPAHSVAVPACKDL
jgi:hypothetical protein